jgi:hypothetical protein
MKLGYRVFAVAGDEITPIPQRTFDDFLSDKKPVLKQYAGTTVDFAMVIYETKDRRPHRFVRLDGTRCKILKNGGLDQEHDWDSMQLAALSLKGVLYPFAEENISGVIDATDRFNLRRLKHKYSAKFSEAAKQKMLAYLGLRNG